jgi:uncharacterized protein DUF6064
MLPFSSEQFLAVFVKYNNAIWPIQIAAYLLGGIAVALLFRKTREADRIIAAILAMMWLWTGFGYHGLSFSVINKAAYPFAALFVVQGICFIYAGVYRQHMRFGLRPGTATWVGIVLVAYAAILYPLIGVATGHRYPEMPMFGVTPCPVTIFTLGMLLLTIGPVPHWILVAPGVWSVIGGSAAMLLNVPQDWLLLVSGIVTVSLMMIRDRPALPSIGIN